MALSVSVSVWEAFYSAEVSEHGFQLVSFVQIRFDVGH
eukprot:CAMPEP_0117887674 /NCGR_PEP_ID=MMETSP0950-20121206/21308_1 /TAXON_ID=44440 /ORGANISM="Chattonella subsalsa, Strain CCMP2191" /LENGTH=37 /DNA_ID= /DNA_START= /DNA_END= /DNA_ORIENTATION=